MRVGDDRPYVEAGYALGVDFDHDGRAGAALDMDGDGDLDLALQSMQGVMLLRNESPVGAAWARFELTATRSQPLALGAVLSVRAAGRTQVDRVRIVAGFHSQHARALHFGLGAARALERVQVRWPSGATETFTGARIGRLNRLVEGQGVAQPVEIPRWPAGAGPRMVGRPSLDLKVRDSAGGVAPIARPGRPTLVNFFAPSCVPCGRELPALAALHARRPQVQIALLTAEPERPKANADFLAAKAPQLSFALADDRVVAAYFGPGGRVPLPSTFIFDETGRLRRAFLREVDAATLDEALDEARASGATVDYQYLLHGLSVAGKEDEARRLLRVARDRLPDDPFTRVQLAELHLHLQDAQQAIELLLPVVARDDATFEALVLAGTAYAINGELVPAEATLGRALARQPDDTNTLFLLGSVSMDRGHFSQAVEWFTRAQALDPRNPMLGARLDAAKAAARGEPSPP